MTDTAGDADESVGEVAQAAQGTQGQGTQGQGTQGQGTQGTYSGAALNGKLPTGYQLGKARTTGANGYWYFPNGTEIVNASTLASIAPTSGAPFTLTGVVRPAPGTTFSGISGDTVNLRIVGYATDSTSNLLAQPPANPFALAGSSSNNDVTLYKVEYKDGLTWKQVCPLGGRGVAGAIDANGANWAMLVRGTYDAEATASELTTGFTAPGAGAEFTIACTNGVVSKCARQWGYKPFKSAPNFINGVSMDLRPYHQACLRAARADYCSDGSSFTVDGTTIDMEDSQGLVQREIEQNGTTYFAGESVFTTDHVGAYATPEGGASCLLKTRYDQITSVGACTLTDTYHGNSCYPYGGRSFSRDPSNIGSKYVWVGSKNYCADGCSPQNPSACHTTAQTGAKMAQDCNYCTMRVCDPAGAGIANASGSQDGPIAPSPTTGDSFCCTNTWDAQCVSEAAAWCTPSVWSAGGATTWTSYDPSWDWNYSWPADWYSQGDPWNAVYRSDFVDSPRVYGPLGTAPYGTPGNFPSNSAAQWIGSKAAGQADGYYRYRFRGFKTGTATLHIAAYNTFSVYFDGALLGSGSAPGTHYWYSVSMSLGKEHLVAVKVTKPGGGNVFALDIR